MEALLTGTTLLTPGHGDLLGTQHLIEEFPGRAGLLRGHFLDGVSDMHHDIVPDTHLAFLQHEQADVAADTLGLTIGDESVDLDDAYR